MFKKKSKPYFVDKSNKETVKEVKKVYAPKPQPVVVKEPEPKVIDHCLCCENKCMCCDHPPGITTHFCKCPCHA